MCDTIYCGSAAGLGSSSFFGKNSDRHPEEPQAVLLCRGTKLSSLLPPESKPELSFLLSKPSWMEGGEMGINERGVSIGNEAVFSRFKPAKEGILGMDILRAALASATTAWEAVQFITCFVEAHDQGGNGSFKGSLYYDNSFIVADPESAYVVETAGRRWAWKAIEGRDSISNTYRIEEDYKRLDTQTRKEIAPVNERAACSDEADPGRKGEKESFKGHVENRFYLRFTKGEDRRALSLSRLRGFDPASGGIQGFLDILREHGPCDPAHPRRDHMKALCVHDSGVPPTATTASLAVEYRADRRAVVWFSGTSYPCLSLYKPVLLEKGNFVPLWTTYDLTEAKGQGEGSGDQYTRWAAWRERVRKDKAARRANDAGFVAVREKAQDELALAVAHALAKSPAHSSSLGGIELDALRSSVNGIVDSWERDAGF